MKNIIRLISAVALFIFFLIFLNCSKSNSEKIVQVRCLSYNIYHGEDMNGGSNLESVASIIKSVSADIVALQEVDKNVSRSNGIDLAAELSRLTGMHFEFGKAMDFDGGEYGEAILSRYPILEHMNHALPFSPGHEPRAALAVIVQLPNGKKFKFIGTHLDHPKDSPDRIQQAKRINEIIKRDPMPTILAGDLNDMPGSEPIQILNQHWTDAALENAQATYPSDVPERRIDYIMFFPKNRWRVIDSRVLDEKIVSDHRPVLTVLELLPAPNKQ